MEEAALKPAFAVAEPDAHGLENVSSLRAGASLFVT